MAETWTIRGIAVGAGICTCCGRTMRRVFTITNGQAERTVGVKCCQKMTGWTPNERMVAAARKRELAALTYGPLWETVAEQVAHEVAQTGSVSGAAGEARGALVEWHGAEEQRMEFVTQCLRASIGTFGAANPGVALAAGIVA